MLIRLENGLTPAWPFCVLHRRMCSDVVIVTTICILWGNAFVLYCKEPYLTLCSKGVSVTLKLGEMAYGLKCSSRAQCVSAQTNVLASWRYKVFFFAFFRNVFFSGTTFECVVYIFSLTLSS